MPLQNFIDNQLPTVKAVWLNAIDAFYFTLFQSSTTAAQAVTALGLPLSTGAASVGFTAAGASGAVRTLQALGRDVVNVANYFANGVSGALADSTGVTDSTGAIQAAHDALPSTGGTIYFPDGFWLEAVDGTYVNITKPNVTVLGSANAWVCSPASSLAPTAGFGNAATEAEVRTGTRFLNGFNVTGNNFTCSVNMRGPLVLWTPATALDVISIRNMKFLNMYNAGLSISNAPFALADIDGVQFSTSRDLSSDAGNYECISRSCNGNTANYGQVVRVNRSYFNGIAGGIDAHCVKNVVVGGGTKFNGCNQFSIKLATLDSVTVKQNLTVDKSVTFDGTAINAASVNRHLNCTGDARTSANFARYLGFIQVFDKVDFSGKGYNFSGNIGVDFLNGSFTDAEINLDGSEFETCTNAILDPQGTVNMVGARFSASGWLSTSAGAMRSLNIARCKLIDSPIQVTKKSVAVGDLFRFLDNDISYGVDNNGAVRFTNFGTDNGPTFIVDRNKFTMTGGKTVAADLSLNSASSAGGIWGNENQVAAGITVTNGIYPNAYEQTTTAGATNLFLFKLHAGEMTVVNPGAAGTITYGIADSALVCPVGTVFHAVQTSAAQVLAFTTAANKLNGNGQDAKTTVTSATKWASITFTKIAADTWVATSQLGTWNYT